MNGIIPAMKPNQNLLDLLESLEKRVQILEGENIIILNQLSKLDKKEIKEN